jgi:hypothetical protein
MRRYTLDVALKKNARKTSYAVFVRIRLCSSARQASAAEWAAAIAVETSPVNEASDVIRIEQGGHARKLAHARDGTQEQIFKEICRQHIWRRAHVD